MGTIEYKKKEGYCMCGRKIGNRGGCSIALNQIWHHKCYELYKIAYKEGYDKKFGEVTSY